jgi:hypothetical protein
VVTITALPACRERGGGHVGAAQRAASVRVDPAGRIYMQGHSCDEAATCNPPPPLAIDCPAEDRLAEPTRDDYRPANRVGWLRVKESVAIVTGGCYFNSDHYCPPTKAAGAYDDYRNQSLHCAEVTPDAFDTDAPPPLHLRRYRVDSFTALRAGNSPWAAHKPRSSAPLAEPHTKRGFAGRYEMRRVASSPFPEPQPQRQLRRHPRS